MPNVGPLEIIIVLIIALLVFGPKRLPDLGRSLGKGLNEFRSGLQNLGEDLQSDEDDEVESDFDEEADADELPPELGPGETSTPVAEAEPEVVETTPGAEPEVTETTVGVDGDPVDGEEAPGPEAGPDRT